MATVAQAADNQPMLDVNTLKAQDLQGLSPSAMADLAAQMLAQMAALNAQLQARDQQAAAHIQEMKFKDPRRPRTATSSARLTQPSSG